MSSIPTDVVTKLSTAQNQIWETVSLTVTEASGKSVNFGSPLTIAAKTADIFNELGSAMLVIQFAFATMPENPQVILLPQDSVIDLATLAKGELVGAVDENLIADIRPVLEGIVQGICLAVGNIKNEPTVASGLSIRYQTVSLPGNLQRSEEVVRSQVAISAEGLNGTAIWILDKETAQLLLGLDGEDENVIYAPFAQQDEASPTVKPHLAEDSGGLDLLLDIPLEISVELGRVKMMVKDVVELGSGSIIEIDKAAGEPVDVLVNGRIVARGEVVVIEDNFGVRITEILNPQERMSRLSEVV